MERIFSSQVTTDATVTTTTETVAVTISNVTPPRAGVTGVIRGFVEITTGTGTTALTVRVRRGTDTTGAVVGEGNPGQVQVAAGSTEVVDIAVEDALGDVNNASYVVTVQQTGATGNGSILFAEASLSVAG